MPTVVLRPNSDINIGHTKYQNGSTASGSAYTFIDDVVSDEDATTIGQAHQSTTLTRKTSTFGLGGETHNHKIFVNSIKIYNDYFCNNPAKNGKMTSVAIAITLSVNGTKSSEIKTTLSDVNTQSDSGSYKTITTLFNSSNFSELSNVFDSLSALNLQFDISTE